MTPLLFRLFLKEDAAENRAAVGRLCGAAGITANVLLFAAKLTAGLLSGSLSIAADAVNNLTDASSGVVSLLGFRIAEKPADPEHPYGHARAEYLSGLLISVFILVVGVELARESAARILHPEPVAFTVWTAAVLAVSILVKLWMARLYRAGEARTGSGALKAAAADSRGDAVSTAAVLAAAVFDSFSNLTLDGWVGAAVAIFILVNGVKLVRETMDPLLGRAPDAETVAMIRERILSYPGVLGTHDLMIHDYGPGRQFASVHVEVAAEADVLESHDMIDNIERDFLRRDGIHMVVHMDPIVTTDSETGALRAFLTETVREIDPVLTVHDLRIVPGKTHVNAVFDCVAPHAFRLSDAALCAAIRERVRAQYPDTYCVITVDHSFAALPHEQ